MTLPLTGTSTVSRDACQKLLLSRNPTAPLEVLNHYYEMQNEWSLRGDVLFCQMLHETDFLRSWWSQPPRRNMAGIGVTGASQHTNPNSPAWAFKSADGNWYMGYSFGDWAAAVEAHFAHVSAYVWPDEHNRASQKDPRYGAAKQAFASKGWAYCKVLTDLNGRWAVPGTTYGQMIEGIWNSAAALQPATPPVPATVASTQPTAIKVLSLQIEPTPSHSIGQVALATPTPPTPPPASDEPPTTSAAPTSPTPPPAEQPGQPTSQPTPPVPTSDEPPVTPPPDKG